MLTNLFDLILPPEQHEHVDTLLSHAGIRIERILSWGQTTAGWYDQAEDEWVVLLKGHARLAWQNGREQTLKEGDLLFIPAHQPHRVSWTDPDNTCIWLTIHWTR